jgi:hypothetical protein
VKRQRAKKGEPSPLELLDRLLWLDGSPLAVERYRRDIFRRAFSVDAQGVPRYSLILCGRGKKNAKSLDLVLAGISSLLLRESAQGSGGYLLANDLDQADDDLDLAKKLTKANPLLRELLVIRAKALERRDGRGELLILPAGDVKGSHGKSATFLGYDEIHEYRDYSLLEALSPDPTRRDVLTWICSYDSLWHTPGRPLWDMYRRGRVGEDARMLFSWYSGDFTTDPAAAELPPEQRANPSMGAWTNPRYLEEQRLRLPSSKFRRLHLNLGGQPEGAALSAEKIEAAVVEGRKSLPRVEGVPYFAFVDMSGGSNDDACLAVAHADGKRVVLDLVMDQGPRPPFDPRKAVKRFAPALREYGLSRVTGDAYAGQTFRADFEADGIEYQVESRSASDLYGDLEPRLNSGEVELLDVPKLAEQFVGLVWKGGKITHVSGEHDDYANAAAGALLLARSDEEAWDGSPLGVGWRQNPFRVGDVNRKDADGDSLIEGAVPDSGGALSSLARRRRSPFR